MLPFCFLVTFIEPLHCQWVKTVGFTNGVYLSIISFNDKMFACIDTANNIPRPSRIFISSDNGDSWVSSHEGLDSTFLSWRLFRSDSAVYAISAGGLYKTKEPGTPWEKLSRGSLDGVALGSLLLIGAELYVGTDGCRIFRSSDGGRTWNQLTQFYTDGYTDGYVSNIQNIGDTLFAYISMAPHTHSNYTIRRSFNKGNSWVIVYESPDLNAPNIIYGSIYVDDPFNNGIFVSGDLGVTWRKYASRDQLVLWPIYIVNNNVFAGARIQVSAIKYYYTILLSTNQGANWIDIGTGFDSTAGPCSIVADKDYIYVGTDKGLWRRLLRQMVSVENYVTDLPSKATLKINYPNPIREKSSISYFLPEKMRVTIYLYDEYGRIAEKIVEGEMEAGSHLAQIDASRLRSGIYFYTLESGKERITRHCCIVK